MLSLTVLILLGVSCVKLEDDGQICSDEWTLNVALSAGPEVKVGLAGETLHWELGDQVSVLAVSGGASPVASSPSVLTLNNVDSGLGEAKFRGTVVISSEPEKCFFAYPAQSQISADGSVVFDYSVQDARVYSPYLIGAAEYDAAGMECTMNHAGALIRLRVPEGVTKVTVSANSLYSGTAFSYEPIAMAMVLPDGTSTAVSGSGTSISAIVSDDAVNYIVIPALTFTNGFAFALTKDDGSTMIRSYSADGGDGSGYSFRPGTVLDIDMSEAFTPVSVSCELEEAEHYLNEDLISRTDIKIRSYSVEGVSSKVVDRWGISLFRKQIDPSLPQEQLSSDMIAWMTQDGVFDYAGGPLKNFNNWKLIMPGTYYLYASCEVNGERYTSYVGTYQVPALPVEIQMGLTALTTYSQLTNDQSKRKSIYDIKVTTNIDPELLQNENYKFSLWVRDSDDSSKGQTLYSTDVDSNILSLESMTDMSLGAHTLKASMTFGNQTFTKEISNLYVTGLPVTYTDIGALNKTTVTKNDFWLPADTNVTIDVDGTVTGQGGWGMWADGSTTNCILKLSGTQLGAWSATGEKAGLTAGSDETITINSSLDGVLKSAESDRWISISADADNANITSLSVKFR